MHHVVRGIISLFGVKSPWLAFLIGLLATSLHWVGADFHQVSHWMILSTGSTISLLLFICISADLAERKLAQKELHDQERQYRSVFEATTNALVIFDRNGVIVDINPATSALYGYPRTEMVGKPAQRFVRRDNWHMLKTFLDEVESQGMYFAQKEGTRRDGTSFEMEIRGSSFLFRGVPHILAVITDITERNRVERESRDYANALEAANASLEQYSKKMEAATRAKSAFLADMSHEIRTPLTAILGFAEFLRQEEDAANAPASRIEAIDTILRNGAHLLRLINDLLDLSKIESGRFEVERAACSPVEILSRMRELMEHRACEKRVPLAIQATTPIPATIYSDTTRVYQILINLLGNAIKFTDKGEVRLDVRLISEGRGSPRLEFVVSDTGIGMTQEQLARLFQPFAQADHSITERFGGTGLGLSVSKRLANLLGGDIRVQSEPGRGSTFVFELPTGPLDNVPLVQTIEPRPTAVQAPANTSIRLDRSTRVLLAEDGPDNQRLISLILRKAGAEVSTVENGQAAVETAMDALHKGTPFDVVLMDMHMPVLDGFAAVRQLRQAGYAHPIIALTAEAMRDDRNKCLSAGCDDYASKPIQRDVLLALVAKAASRRAAGLMKK